MMRFLSSMRLAFWSLIALLLWLLVGVIIANSPSYYEATKAMNLQVLSTWLTNEALHQPVLLSWFLVLCAMCLVLGVSFLFCTSRTLLKKVQTAPSLKTTLLFTLHLLCMGIMLLHLFSMSTGFKYSNIQLEPGQSWTSPEGYHILLRSVQYTDDVSVLNMPFRQQRQHQSPNEFHYRKNTARMSLSKNGVLLAESNIGMLTPLVYRSLRITLSSFYLPQNTNSQVPGVSLVFGKNSVIWPFFVCYGLGVFLIAFYTLISWKSEADNL